MREAGSSQLLNFEPPPASTTGVGLPPSLIRTQVPHNRMESGLAAGATSRDPIVLGLPVATGSRAAGAAGGDLTRALRQLHRARELELAGATSFQPPAAPKLTP